MDEEQTTKMAAEASVNKEDFVLDEEGAIARFDVLSFQVSALVFTMDDYLEEGMLGSDVVLFFHGGMNKDRYRSMVSLAMTPERARQLAEAILASVMTPQQN